MLTLINHLNNIIKDSTFILHIEPSATAIKALIKVDYTLYRYKNNSERPYKIWSLSRTIKAENAIEELDNEIEEELLKFILKGGLNE